MFNFIRNWEGAWRGKVGLKKSNFGHVFRITLVLYFSFHWAGIFWKLTEWNNDKSFHFIMIFPNIKIAQWHCVVITFDPSSTLLTNIQNLLLGTNLYPSLLQHCSLPEMDFMWENFLKLYSFSSSSLFGVQPYSLTLPTF